MVPLCPAFGWPDELSRAQLVGVEDCELMYAVHAIVSKKSAVTRDVDHAFSYFSRRIFYSLFDACSCHFRDRYCVLLLVRIDDRKLADGEALA